jgi:hypothetical protein
MYSRTDDCSRPLCLLTQAEALFFVVLRYIVGRRKTFSRYVYIAIRCPPSAVRWLHSTHAHLQPHNDALQTHSCYAPQIAVCGDVLRTMWRAHNGNSTGSQKLPFGLRRSSTFTGQRQEEIERKPAIWFDGMRLSVSVCLSAQQQNLMSEPQI